MRLAQKTGYTLIVHNKTGKDVVIMDVDQYEGMHDMQDIYFGDNTCDCSTQLHEMDEVGMLDKINRDIAVWRSHKDMDEGLYRNYETEHDLGDHLPDSFEENTTPSPEWFKAGDVLEDKHSDFLDDEEDEDDYAWDDNDNDEIVSENDFDLESFPSLENIINDEQSKDELSEISEEGEEEVMYDSLGEASLGNIKDKKDIPFIDHGDREGGVKEEPIDDDEPVFFEEPV
ncbi:hypothetical protein HN481_04745 [Candidatus Parcubacteria bacterium]|nr:hypothetical protein [Candidatus Parcubacteria bacterium]